MTHVHRQASRSPDTQLGARTFLALLLFALAIRLPTLSLRQLVEGDGVHYAQLARTILSGDASGLANPYWSNLWPAVIAAASWLTRLDVVTAGRLAALVAGFCLVPVTARLAARTHGATTGLVAGLLAAGHPWLVHFSTLVFAESFFALLLMTVLLAAQRSTSDGRAAVAGLLGGLAVVTRPEGYAVVAAVTCYLVARAARQRLRRAFARAALFAGLVALFVLGRGLLVHHYHGKWDFGIGTKGTANLLLGLAETDSERERLRTEPTPEGGNRFSEVSENVTLVGFARTHPGLVLAHIGRNLELLLAGAFRVFPQVPLVGGRPAPWEGGWPPALAGLAALACFIALWGAARGWFDRASRPDTALLALTMLVYLGGLAPLNVHDRLLVGLVPLFLIFLAHGLVSCLAWLPTRVGPCQRQLALSGLVGAQAVLSLALLLRAPVLDYAGDPLVQRQAGEWLRAHYPQTTRVMSASPFVGYYFHDVQHDANDVELPWAEEPRLVALARSQKVDLLVAPEWHLRAARHPAAAILSDPASCLPELRHVATLGEERTGRVFVYEVGPDPTPSPGTTR